MTARREALHTEAAGERPSARSEAGNALLATLVLTAALAATTATLQATARNAATDLQLRRDVLCALYAARGAVLLTGASNGDDLASVIGGGVKSLAMRYERRGGDVCTLVATTTCGRAVRRAERNIGPAETCG